MLSRSDVDSALKSLASRHGIDGLALDEGDSAVLEFGEDGALIFEFSEPEGSLTLWSPLCTLDLAETAEAERRLLKGLLSLNFPAARLHGAHVALNAETGVVLLARSAVFPPGQPEVLTDLAQKFAIDVEDILGKLKDGSLLDDNEEFMLQAKSGLESFVRA